MNSILFLSNLNLLSLLVFVCDVCVSTLFSFLSFCLYSLSLFFFFSSNFSHFQVSFLCEAKKLAVLYSIESLFLLWHNAYGIISITLSISSSLSTVLVYVSVRAVVCAFFKCPFLYTIVHCQ